MDIPECVYLIENWNFFLNRDDMVVHDSQDEQIASVTFTFHLSFITASARTVNDGFFLSEPSVVLSKGVNQDRSVTCRRPAQNIGILVHTGQRKGRDAVTRSAMLCVRPRISELWQAGGHSKASRASPLSTSADTEHLQCVFRNTAIPYS
jgi:hypothetical protein